MTPDTRQLAAHLALALARHENACARDGIRTPSEVTTIRELLTRAATDRQEPTLLATSSTDLDSGCVVNNPVLTIAETARLLSVSKRTVERLIASGALVAVRMGSAATRVRRIDLDAYLAGLSHPTGFRETMTKKDTSGCD